MLLSVSKRFSKSNQGIMKLWRFLGLFTRLPRPNLKEILPNSISRRLLSIVLKTLKPGLSSHKYLKGVTNKPVLQHTIQLPTLCNIRWTWMYRRKYWIIYLPFILDLEICPSVKRCSTKLWNVATLRWNKILCITGQLPWPFDTTWAGSMRSSAGSVKPRKYTKIYWKNTQAMWTVSI